MMRSTEVLCTGLVDGFYSMLARCKSPTLGNLLQATDRRVIAKGVAEDGLVFSSEVIKRRQFKVKLPVE